MTYRIVQLAPGSYDVELDGKIIASLVRGSASKRWYAELLDERLPYPAPFTAARHRFDSFAEAVTWLGNPEVHARKLKALKRKRVVTERPRKIQGEQCRAARRLVGWSQVEHAYHAGVGPQSISGFERGEMVPRAETMAAMIGALETAGVEFTENGVRLKSAEAERP